MQKFNGHTSKTKKIRPLACFPFFMKMQHPVEYQKAEIWMPAFQMAVKKYPGAQMLQFFFLFSPETKTGKVSKNLRKYEKFSEGGGGRGTLWPSTCEIRLSITK